MSAQDSPPPPPAAALASAVHTTRARTRSHNPDLQTSTAPAPRVSRRTRTATDGPANTFLAPPLSRQLSFEPASSASTSPTSADFGSLGARVVLSVAAESTTSCGTRPFRRAHPSLLDL
ncbi:unnamed protein product [Peniophora sp. CBMAI 1063]|nr:unnamed protein product [Peniophora sp. CBMAI 1063]